MFDPHQNKELANKILLKAMKEAQDSGFRNSIIDEKQHIAIIEALQNGANPDCKIDDIAKNTPLLLAILFGDKSLAIEIIKLDKLHKSINITDEYVEARNTPLILAIKKGMYDVALLLLDNGADPNLSSKEGFTPLHFACGLLGADNNLMLLEVINKLLEKGANPTLKNMFGSRPVDLLHYIPCKEDFIYVQENVNYRIARHFNFTSGVVNSFFTEQSTELLAKSPKYQRIKTFLDRDIEFNNALHNLSNIADEEQKERERDRIYEDYADVNKVLNNDPPTYYSYSQIIRLNLHGAKTFEDVYRLIENGVFEEPQKMGIPISIDLKHAHEHSDFMSIVSDTCWHREDNLDLLVKQLMNDRTTFLSTHADKIKQLVERMQTPAINRDRTASP